MRDGAAGRASNSSLRGWDLVLGARQGHVEGGPEVGRRLRGQGAGKKASRSALGGPGVKRPSDPQPSSCRFASDLVTQQHVFTVVLSQCPIRSLGHRYKAPQAEPLTRQKLTVSRVWRPEVCGPGVGGVPCPAFPQVSGGFLATFLIPPRADAPPRSAFEFAQRSPRVHTCVRFVPVIGTPLILG